MFDLTAEEAMDLIAELAGLGLPSSFTARSEISSRKKGRKKLLSHGRLDEETKKFTVRADRTAGHDILSEKFCAPPVRPHPGLDVEGDSPDLSIEVSQEIPSIGDGAENLPHANTETFIARGDEGAGLGFKNDDLVRSYLTDNSDADHRTRWVPNWDERYQCYYFYDRQTGESSWEPPPVLEEYSTRARTALEECIGFVHSVVTSSLDSSGCYEEIKYEDVEDCGLKVHSSAALVGIVGDEEGLSSPLDMVKALAEYEKGVVTVVPGDSKDGNTWAADVGENGATERKEMESCSAFSQFWASSTQAAFSQFRASPTQSTVSQCLMPSKMGIKERRSKSFSGAAECDKVLLPGMVEMMSKSIVKYWKQRYSLFSKYDEGIKMDEEGWFSVTPEPIAEHQAARCATGLVVDAFAGVGGNAIQLALKCEKVIAIDIDSTRIEYARHNAEIYGVADKIDFIVGDFFQLAPFLKADAVFLSPPWGGPEYLKQETYDLHTMLKPKDGCTLFKVAQKIAPSIVLYVPRNVDFKQLEELSWLSSPPLPFDVENNYVNDRFKAVTAYYGDIACQDI